MIFSEVYGSYFNAVAAILTKAVDGTLTGKELTSVISDKAFGESNIAIPKNLSDGTWPLLNKDMITPLKNVPSMPLTELQKRWLKALLLDPRILLFNPSEDGLDDVEPLFTPDMFVYYDRYQDGDPYQDGEYIHNFRVILTALREKRKVRVRFKSGRGNRQSWIIIPQKLEYSSKDDKFRVVSASNGHAVSVNLARIKSAVLLDYYSEDELEPFSFRMKTLVMELTDERNALERCMLHFSNLEKETERLDDRHYRINLHYEQEDETEILIRILSFGPVLKVTEPERFVKLIRERLKKQKALM